MSKRPSSSQTSALKARVGCRMGGILPGTTQGNRIARGATGARREHQAISAERRDELNVKPSRGQSHATPAARAGRSLVPGQIDAPDRTEPAGSGPTRVSSMTAMVVAQTSNGEKTSLAPPAGRERRYRPDGLPGRARQGVLPQRLLPHGRPELGGGAGHKSPGCSPDTTRRGDSANCPSDCRPSCATPIETAPGLCKPGRPRTRSTAAWNSGACGLTPHPVEGPVDHDFKAAGWRVITGGVSCLPEPGPLVRGIGIGSDGGAWIAKRLSENLCNARVGFCFTSHRLIR
jgi:hypothetical protein